MSVTNLTTFISLTIGNSNAGRYQNGSVGQIIAGHQYLSFIYQGAAKNRTGDNLVADLVLSANQLSMNAVRTVVDKRGKVAVETWVMSSDFRSRQRMLTSEQWLAASMTYDTENIEVILSSAIDAVVSLAPNRVLTRQMCGDLPVSGNIQAR